MWLYLLPPQAHNFLQRNDYEANPLQALRAIEDMLLPGLLAAKMLDPWLVTRRGVFNLSGLAG